MVRPGLTAAILGLLGLSLAAFAGSVWFLLDLLACLRLHFAVLALAAAALALVVRARVAAALGVVALLVNGVPVWNAYHGRQARPAAGVRLALAHVNMQGLDGDLDEFERVLRERHPDVMVVLETSRLWHAELASGVAGYGIVPSADDDDIVLARVPLGPDAPTTLLPRDWRRFHVRLGTRAVRVLAIHTPSPISAARSRERDRQLHAAALWAAGPGPAAIVLGDLNATPWSHAFRDLAHTGHLHSSLRGFPFQASWPATLRWAGVPIDHLLYTDGLAVVDRETGPSFGSAHRSLWVTVAPA